LAAGRRLQLDNERLDDLVETQQGGRRCERLRVPAVKLGPLGRE
jgi:hypothetical protein